MSSAVRAIARTALTGAVAAVLGLSTLAAAAATSVDELVAMSLRAWDDEPELLYEVYAPGGVHSATFYDRTNQYAGPDEILRVARYPIAPEVVGPRIDIPAPDGEWRWASFMTLAGGSACLFHAVDGRIVRHDCILPERTTDSRPAAAVTSDADTMAAIDEIVSRLDAAWATGATLETVEAVYAPDAVHTARFLDRTRSYAGPDQIDLVAGTGGPIDQIDERVVFEAPEGELAWASVVDVAGGSVCLYRARDGMVVRHDCVLPISG